MRKENTNAILDIELERLALGELNGDREAAARRSLVAIGDGNGLDAIHASNESILAKYPPRVMALQIEERLHRAEAREPSPSRARVLIPGVAAAAVAVLLVVAFAPKRTASPPGAVEEGIRLKGVMAPSLSVYRKGMGKEPLARGDRVTQGDVVQLAYNAKGATHGVIFSIDGRGTVTLHFPSEPTGSTALETKGANVLDFSYELDDAPKFERFFFVTAHNPLDVDEVLEKAHRLGAVETGELPLEAGLSQCDFVLKKTSRTM